jgi:AraC-like DNA-binding protein
MARVVGVSTSRLRHVFKEHTSLTPSQFLMNHRMECAKEMLVTTNISIKEVMVAAGVSDPSNFTRYFKRRFSITPTDLRTLSQLRHFERPREAEPHPPAAVTSLQSWRDEHPLAGGAAHREPPAEAAEFWPAARVSAK